MRHFARLYRELDATTRTGEKHAALVAYFREASAADAAWAVAVLTGSPIKRAMNRTELVNAAEAVSGLPAWLIAECRTAVGDSGETLALLVPPPGSPRDLSLREVIEERLIPMRRQSAADRTAAMVRLWDELAENERLSLHKLLSGTFRVGVSKAMVVRALAVVAGVATEEMAARLMGDVARTPEAFAALLKGDGGTSEAGGEARLSRPYPFFLAQQLAGSPEQLGARAGWQAEWKWDGVRAQVIRRGARVMVWSRGEELMTEGFPEIAGAAEDLPAGTVLDGEVLAWDSEKQRPLAFGHLQTRIGVKRREARLFDDVPVRFMAYDMLEWAGEDVRSRPLVERRSMLEAVVGRLGVGAATPVVGCSPVIEATDWESLARIRSESRERGVEGMMLKRLDSPYGVGRARRAVEEVGADGGGVPAGDWWKWKMDPYVVDCVLVAAQPGSGRRAGLLTDYTFAVWSGEKSGEGELVTVTKAYSGLTDEEIKEVDRWVRQNTTASYGPVMMVKPERVFEVAFEGIGPSPRHKAGLALRFPRMARMRPERGAGEADTTAMLWALVPADVAGAGAGRTKKAGRASRPGGRA